MVDCGAVKYGNVGQYLIDEKPNESRRPGEWAARYVRRHIATAGRDRIDTFILTHFHDDHMGEMPAVDEPARRSRFGNYQLTGLLDLAELVPITRIIDRGYPMYDYPVPQTFPHMQNYKKFLQSLRERGGTVERLEVGSREQVRLVRDPDKYGTFVVQNLAANGVVWTGISSEVKALFPALELLTPENYPTENKCSLALRLSYGKFDYFTAGDMDHEVKYGRWPWGDVETEVARVAGPVEVAVANHHGYVNACGPDWVRALRPRAVVILAWNQGHPAMPSIENMLSKDLYVGPRDIFATAFKPESKVAVAEIQRMQSDNGHVIVRVAPGGDTYEIFITTNSDESDRIVKRFGPYGCT